MGPIAFLTALVWMQTGESPKRALLSEPQWNDVEPIIAAHCGECHRPGGVGPFSLLTFEDVKKRGGQITAVTKSRYMPPWLPMHGDDLPELVGKRGLSNQQIESIGAWVKAGASEGDRTAVAAPPEAPAPEAPPPNEDTKWPLGEPDLILKLDQPFELQAEGLDVVHTFLFRNDTMQDAFIGAVDVRCSNPQAIHHASFSVDQTGRARMLDKGDPRPGYPTMGDIGLNLAASHGIWSVGSNAGVKREQALLPAGVARPFLVDSDLVAEVHFKPTGKVERLDLEIGVYLKNEQITRFPTAITLGSFAIDIPVGEKSYMVRDSFVAPVDSQLLGVAPRAHYVCKKMMVRAILPDGETKLLLRIDDWDFNWLQEFRFAAPVCLPEGTRMEMEFEYDNSAENPRNPNHPPRPVRDGYRPTEEMGLLFLYLVPEQRGDFAKLEEAKEGKLREMMERARKQRGAP
ncbi:MAG: hypothetical protein L0Y44_09415 [Phycisphaerales bacterium]|nr:hypothetical protein [Phycisphaerales bacterium]MCI0630857.1 hypothetical protein [Phycisphaerales bacterium]MCI0674669.1 hypothetical protein [Phycisphaerales bacterium]